MRTQGFCTCTAGLYKYRSYVFSVLAAAFCTGTHTVLYHAKYHLLCPYSVVHVLTVCVHKLYFLMHALLLSQRGWRIAYLRHSGYSANFTIYKNKFCKDSYRWSVVAIDCLNSPQDGFLLWFIFIPCHSLWNRLIF